MPGSSPATAFGGPSLRSGRPTVSASVLRQHGPSSIKYDEWERSGHASATAEAATEGSHTSRSDVALTDCQRAIVVVEPSGSDDDKVARHRSER